MHDFMKGIGVLLGVIVFTACASTVPPNRLGSYLSPDNKTAPENLTKLYEHPLKTGLVLVSDTSAPDAAPNLPDEALVRLGEQLKQEISRALPVTITEVISAEQIRPQPNGDWAQFTDLGRIHKLDHLVVVVLSSTEEEYPWLELLEADAAMRRASS